MAFIYKTTNIINNKIYVGKSKFNNPDYLGSGLKISGAIKKYGKENFSKSIIEECLDSTVNAREIFWISQLNSNNEAIGYNISKGGEGGNHYWTTLTEEEKTEHNKKISNARTGQLLGPRTKKTKKKQSKSFWEHAEKNPEFFKERALAKCKSYVCVNHNTNIVYRTKNLKEFCEEQNLNFESMRHNARTRKNFYDKIWSCSFDKFDSIIDEEIIKLLEEEVQTNNEAYKKKIGRYQKTNGNLHNTN
jgi:group I intron endonuclease